MLEGIPSALYWITFMCPLIICSGIGRTRMTGCVRRCWEDCLEAAVRTQFVGSGIHIEEAICISERRMVIPLPSYFGSRCFKGTYTDATSIGVQTSATDLQRRW